jgi:hypothetical protein|tara:strand:+ start:179 stop:397 length:219 start_codon:yes stop_codon:yes gene_type:complete
MHYTKNNLLCVDCKSKITEFVEVKFIDCVTNKTIYEDRPFCSACLEKDFDKGRLIDMPKITKGKYKNDSIYS